MTSESTYKLIGETFKLRARSLGVTQTKMAHDLNVSIPTVKRWYSGKGLTIASIEKVSEYLGQSLGELFSQIENQNIFGHSSSPH